MLVTKERLFLHIAELLSAAPLFYGHGVLDAEDESMMIMMHLFDESVEEILSSGDLIVNDKIYTDAITLTNTRIRERKPMAYILKSAWFCGMKFNIDERALVPRSPFAELIQTDFDNRVNANKIDTILDLCSGSGCIGISAAVFYKQANVDLADISDEALELSESNIALHNLSHRVNIIHTDLFANVTKKYDLIVSNPPYVSTNEYEQLPEEYLHEPAIGLVSPAQGLEIPVRILFDAPDYLNDGGLLFLEVGYSDTFLDNAFPEIEIDWLEFSNGGQGVCVFEKKKLLEYRPFFKKFLQQNNVL